MTDILICPDGKDFVHMFIDDNLHLVIVVTRKEIKVSKYRGHDPIKKAIETLQGEQ